MSVGWKGHHSFPLIVPLMESVTPAIEQVALMVTDQLGTSE
jgi:hypothetical protein